MSANALKDKTPLVSIVVPMYNVGSFSIPCVKSLAAQTYPNIEVLIIDDGSTDNTMRLVEKAVGDNRRFKIMHKKNGGLSSARNYGNERSSGDYIMYVDGDDMIDSSAVDQMVGAAMSFNVPFVVGSFEKTPPLETYEMEKGASFEVETGRERLRKLLLLRGESGSACGKLFHRSLISQLVFPEGQLFEDLGVVAGICSHVDRLAFSGSPFYAYVTRPDSITTVRGQGLKHVHDMERAVDAVRKACEKSGLEDELGCFQAMCTLRVAMRVSPNAFNDKEDYISYLRRVRNLASRVARSSLVSRAWRLRCALFTISPKIHNIVYALYGALSGKAIC